ncbi:MULTISPECIES: hypothetical protein [unclassified Undibacterium]|uniref:hypothetical protein n=1 Tax=unclassified Undibacterium TaxID=2630295 RepID=UPI002AC9E704|nr:MULTISPECIES: hypothetical protein [unclassified Undibacterium]MEB0140327.1 hypothetical protein [Undibacterium sp. CCC2.1]MEB0172350.1 hypothetical protein [Undibacterium sp. CCC1.1]WPX44360.1 hypothetical protein RHM61_03770 [Undibacterium sp. CCC3.4]
MDKLSHRYVWVGMISAEHLKHCKQAFFDDPTLRAIEYRASPGASADAKRIGAEIEALIDMRRLSTFARGQCGSACAVAFLLGHERVLLASLDQVPTHLFIHVPRNSLTKEMNYGHADRDFKKIVARSGNRFPLSLLEMTYEVKTPEGGLYILRQAVASKENGGLHHVWFCAGDELITQQSCQPVVGVTPQDLGIAIE